MSEIREQGNLSQNRNKQCCKCDYILDIFEFNKSSGRIDGLQRACRLCQMLDDRIRICFNSEHKHYKYYGGRGIIVSDELLDYAVWRRYLLSLDGYGKVDRRGFRYTLDRINNDGNYEVGNIRWVSKRVQRLNTRIPSNGSSKYRGVDWRKGKGWRASICIFNDNRNQSIAHHLGYYKSEEDAAIAYDKAAIKYFGKYANVNFGDK